MEKGTLYVIATPIGNLGDISARALRILGEVDMVFAEDTRVTKKLLNHYDIQTPTKSYHAHSGHSKTDEIIEMLGQGKSVALVSDAGTPGISDPGSELVAHIRKAGFNAVTVPGPSAIVSALSIAGIPTNKFTFLGFIPQKKGRETFFKSLADYDHTVVFYESTHRIVKALQSLVENVPNARITIARELTKIHEEVLQGTAAEIMETLEQNPEKTRGEFVVMVSK